MKRLTTIQFRKEAREFITAWNSQSNLPIETRLITVPKDSPEYVALRRMFDEFSKIRDMSWHEWTNIEYSDEELAASDIFTLHIEGLAGDGGNSLKQVYELVSICSACGFAEHKQIRDLPLVWHSDPHSISFQYEFRHDICITDFGERIVSNKVKELVIEKGIQGVEFRKTAFVGEPPPAGPFSQMKILNSIGPSIPPSPVERSEMCAECGRYRKVLLSALPGREGSEFYFRSDDYHGDWIMETTDRFGTVPEVNPRLVINQAFYQELRSHGVTGYWVLPAHLVDRDAE
jgi:hypothetical protein